MTTCSRPGCDKQAKLIRDGMCRAHAQARGVRRIPARVVKAHINECVDAGWTASAVGDAAGVSTAVIARLMNDHHEWLRRETADRILAVNPHTVTAGWVSAVGASRRTQALMAAGWSQPRIAALYGMSIATVDNLTHHRIQSMQAANHHQIVDAYRRAENTPPRKADARIARRGWPTPIAWDGLDMDNPDHYPTHTPAQVDTFDPVLIDRLHAHINLATGNRKALRAHPEKVNPTDLPRAVRALAERGHNISIIAAALGTTPTRIAHHIGG